ncbi:MAG: HAD family hydrolase [Bacteroidetes bacterium]|nr:HAD family hydrolase [Bacteroidota bacterium]
MIRWFETRGVRLRRLSKVRCIACDLDGTLLTARNTIHPSVLDAIAEARREGIRIILASGRTDGFTRRYAEQTGSTAPIISLNGALIKNADGSLLIQHSLSTRVTETAEEFGRQPQGAQLSWSFFTFDGVVSYDDHPILPHYLRTDSALIRQVNDLQPYHELSVLFCAAGPYRAIQELSVLLAKRTGSSIIRSIYQSGSGKDLYYLEVKNRRINKSIGLKHVIDALGIRRKETAAIGDYSNDIEMCTFAGVSAAMRNGIADLQAAADYTTRMDNNDGGVADFIHLILAHRNRT